MLWTNLPRSIVLSQIEKQMGLRAEASSVSTGWLGHTTIRDVKLSLPLARQATLEVPTMRIDHTWLVGIILGRPLTIEAVELDRPTLHAWQDPAGRWNVGEVAELLARTGGKKQGQETAQRATPSAPAKLPRLLISDATLDVADNAGRATTIEHVTLRGDSEDQLVWKYEASIPDHLALSGRLVSGGDWSHEVQLKLKDLAPWVRPWAKDFPAVALDGEWTGRAGAAGAGGRLRIDNLTVGDTAAHGALLIGEEEGGVVAVRPEALAVAGGASAGAVPAQPGNAGSGNTDAALRLGATAGRVTYDGKRIAVEKLHLIGLGGAARSTGSTRWRPTPGRCRPSGTTWPSRKARGRAAR